MKNKLYRHFDSQDCLLYVGTSTSICTRLSQHKVHSGWYDSIVKITIENFESKRDMLDAEKIAIQNENPKYNIIFSKENKFVHTSILGVNWLANYLEIPVGVLRMELQLKRFPIIPMRKKPYKWLKCKVDVQLKQKNIIEYMQKLKTRASK